MFQTDIFLITDRFINSSSKRGDILIVSKKSSKHHKVGHWNKINDIYEMMIKGKGVFYALQVNDTTYHIHEAIPRGRAEITIVESYRNAVDNIALANSVT